MSNSSRTGFNLIEAAIVLAVIGLVIGGIWVAAAAVQDNLRIRRTADGVLMMASRGQSLIPLSEGTGSWNDITTEAKAMGIVPPDWITASSTKNPLGGTVMVALGSGATPVLELYIKGLTESTCRELLSQLSSSNQSKIIYTLWNDDKAMTAVLPVSYNHAICAPPITVMDFQVRLLLKG